MKAIKYKSCVAKKCGVTAEAVPVKNTGEIVHQKLRRERKKTTDCLEDKPRRFELVHQDVTVDVSVGTHKNNETGPKATRAVARACAQNPVSLAVPCHRVVGKDGDVTGYRWGVARKRALLAGERGA
jgi:O-6-methylguanine DNA methyltransferase